MRQRIVGGNDAAEREPDRMEFSDAEMGDEMVQVFRRDTGIVAIARLRLVAAAPGITDHAVAGLSQCRLLVGPERTAAGVGMQEDHDRPAAARVPVPEPCARQIGQSFGDLELLRNRNRRPHSSHQNLKLAKRCGGSDPAPPKSGCRWPPACGTPNAPTALRWAIASAGYRLATARRRTRQGR